MCSHTVSLLVSFSPFAATAGRHDFSENCRFSLTRLPETQFCHTTEKFHFINLILSNRSVFGSSWHNSFPANSICDWNFFPRFTSFPFFPSRVHHGGSFHIWRGKACERKAKKWKFKMENPFKRLQLIDRSIFPFFCPWGLFDEWNWRESWKKKFSSAPEFSRLLRKKTIPFLSHTICQFNLRIIWKLNSISPANFPRPKAIFKSINKIIISSFTSSFHSSSFFLASERATNRNRNKQIKTDWDGEKIAISFCCRMLPSFCRNNKAQRDEGNWIGKFRIHNYYLLNSFIEAETMKMGKLCIELEEFLSFPQRGRTFLRFFCALCVSVDSNYWLMSEFY